MSKIKNGKMPLSNKTTSSDFEVTENNLLSLDAGLKKELADKGLAYRFIDAKRYQENYGFHAGGWKAYKRELKSIPGSLDFTYGTDPEGFTRRGSMILAVKPIEEQAKQRARIRARTKLTQGYNKKAANDLRELSKESGVSMNVHEGYEDNGGSEE